MFKHIEIDYPKLDREMIDGVRYYDTPDGNKLVSITSIISHYNREIFREWRARVGNEEANKITKQSTSRGTDCTLLLSAIFAIFNYPKSNHYHNFSFYKLNLI